MSVFSKFQDINCGSAQDIARLQLSRTDLQTEMKIPFDICIRILIALEDLPLSTVSPSKQDDNRTVQALTITKQLEEHPIFVWLRSEVLQGRCLMRKHCVLATSHAADVFIYNIFIVYLCDVQTNLATSWRPHVKSCKN